jgi:phage gp46-like protein
MNRIKELAKFADAPEWFATEGLAWAKGVNSAIEARDDLLHRPPVMLTVSDDPGDNILGWNRARRSHQPVAVDDAQLLALLDRLTSLHDEGTRALFWGHWEDSFNDRNLGGE